MRGKQVAPEDRRQMLASIAFLARVGATDALGGGVAPVSLAAVLPESEEQVRERCQTLTDTGQLVAVQGAAMEDCPWTVGKGARRSYLPAGHEATPDDDDGRDGPPRTLAEKSNSSTAE